MRWMMLIAVLGACAAEDVDGSQSGLASPSCLAAGEAVCEVVHHCRGYISTDLCRAEWERAHCATGSDSQLSASAADVCAFNAQTLTCPQVYARFWTFNAWPTCGELDAIVYHRFMPQTKGWACEEIGDALFDRAEQCGTPGQTREEFRAAHVATCCGNGGDCESSSIFVARSEDAQTVELNECLAAMTSCSGSPETSDACLDAIR